MRCQRGCSFVIWEVYDRPSALLVLPTGDTGSAFDGHFCFDPIACQEPASRRGLTASDPPRKPARRFRATAAADGDGAGVDGRARSAPATSPGVTHRAVFGSAPSRLRADRRFVGTQHQ